MRKLVFSPNLGAMQLLVLLAFGASPAFAQGSCADLFPQRTPIELLRLDDSAIERSIVDLVQRYESLRKAGYVEGSVMGQPTRIKFSDEQMKSLPDPEESVGAGLMAPLGQLFDLRRADSGKGVRAVAKVKEFESRKDETEKQLKELPQKIDPVFKAYLYSVLEVRELASGEVMVNVHLGRGNASDPLSRIFRNLMTNYYVNLVSWIYRSSELEPNGVITNAKMLDEITAYAKSAYVFHFHMLFDRNVWNVQLRFLQKLWRDYNGGQSVSEHDFVPFLPFAGSVTAEPMFDQSRPVELKRYFRNPYEDPFSLANASQKNEYFLRYQMLLKVIEGLAPGAELEVHAHQKSQATLYSRFGFSIVQTVESEKYPGVKVYVLRAKREDALAKAQEFFKVRQWREASSSGR